MSTGKIGVWLTQIRPISIDQLVMSYQGYWGHRESLWERKRKSKDGIQAPSGGLSLAVDVAAACGPGKNIWPLGMEASSLTKGSGCLEDSAE